MNSAEELQVGSPMYFRREQTRGVVKWHGLARVIRFEGQSKQRIWLRHGATTVLVSAQQVRLATPEEVEAFDLFLQEQDLHVAPQRGHFDLREPLAPVLEEPEHPSAVRQEAVGPDFGQPGILPGRFPQQQELLPAGSAARDQQEPLPEPGQDLVSNAAQSSQGSRGIAPGPAIAQAQCSTSGGRAPVSSSPSLTGPTPEAPRPAPVIPDVPRRGRSTQRRSRSPANLRRVLSDQVAGNLETGAAFDGGLVLLVEAFLAGARQAKELDFNKMTSALKKLFLEAMMKEWMPGCSSVRLTSSILLMFHLVFASLAPDGCW